MQKSLISQVSELLLCHPGIMGVSIVMKQYNEQTKKIMNSCKKKKKKKVHHIFYSCS